MHPAAYLAASTAGPSVLLVWTYICTIATFGAALLGLVLRAAVQFGRAREAWEANLVETKAMRKELEVYADRVSDHELRIRVLEKIR
jgi:hypothetical protein